jgi:hypothetical protein
MGIVNVFPLSNGEESPVAFQGFLYCLNRSRASSRNGNRNSGIDHRVPKGKYREGISLAHESSLHEIFVIRRSGFQEPYPIEGTGSSHLSRILANQNRGDSRRKSRAHAKMA